MCAVVSMALTAPGGSRGGVAGLAACLGFVQHSELLPERAQ